MENGALEHLIVAADGGNRVAERLLLNHLLASKSTAGIAQLLERKAKRESAVDARFLQAELACFHQYPCEEGWSGVLQACCRAGHKQALVVASAYHGWSGNHEAAAAIGRLIAGEKIPQADMGKLWVEGWSGWISPTWRVVAERDGVSVTRSTTFATRALIGLLRNMLTPLLRPAAVVDPSSGKTIAHPVRFNRVAQWLPEHLGWSKTRRSTLLAEAPQLSGYLFETPDPLLLPGIWPSLQTIDFYVDTQVFGLNGVLRMLAAVPSAIPTVERALPLLLRGTRFLGSRITLLSGSSITSPRCAVSIPSPAQISCAFSIIGGSSGRTMQNPTPMLKTRYISSSVTLPRRWIIGNKAGGSGSV